MLTHDEDIAPAARATVAIRSLDGKRARCTATLSITFGQSYAGSATLSNKLLTNVKPGTAQSTGLTITNQGNGDDTFAIRHSPVPSGWTVTLSSSSVSLEGKHDENDQASINVEVFVPLDALADETVTITVTVTSSGDSSIEITDELEVSVAERHEVDGTVLSNDQTGRSDQTIDFPLTVHNNGNVQDSFRLRACDPNQPGSCATPSWNSIYVDDSGNEVTQISLGAGGS